MRQERNPRNLLIGISRLTGSLEHTGIAPVQINSNADPRGLLRLYPIQNLYFLDDTLYLVESIFNSNFYFRLSFHSPSWRP